MIYPFVISIKKADGACTRWYSDYLHLFDVYADEWDHDADSYRYISAVFLNSNGDVAQVLFECKEYIDGLFIELEKSGEFVEYDKDIEILVASGLLSAHTISDRVNSALFTNPLCDPPFYIDIENTNLEYLIGGINGDGRTLHTWKTFNQSFKESLIGVFNKLDSDTNSDAKTIHDQFINTFTINDFVSDQCLIFPGIEL